MSLRNDPSRLFHQAAERFGVLAVLLLLVVLFSALTWREQQPQGQGAARALMPILAATDPGRAILIAGRTGDEDRRFVEALAQELVQGRRPAAGTVTGEPADLRAALLQVTAKHGQRITVATVEPSAPLARQVIASEPAFQGIDVVTPPPYRWPTFLLASNLLNVANQIAVIAILAIGMTLVIVTGGIDLSVGSLIAFSAVLTAWGIGRLGGDNCGVAGMLLAGAFTILASGATGAFSGLMITRFRIPPFIATLAMMQVASGLAYLIAEGKPIYQIPDPFVLLGRGADPLLGIPFAVWLMLLLYLAAHLLMTRTVWGRYLYAVGGNPEAARLAGVRVNRILLFAYVVSGALAGLGGIVTASQLKSGAPTYGLMYELYVVAAVVVGGTSLAGGEGSILGTLNGAFIIAVIQNGMNLTNVESYTQKVVLGLVILGAVLLDRSKKGRRKG